jgi:hypothetical protein
VAADDAGHLDFRFSDDDKERRRRWRRPARQWHWPLIVIAVVWVGAASAPAGPASTGRVRADASSSVGGGVSPVGSSGGAWRDDADLAVQGDRVLIVADDSGSMLGDRGAYIRLRDVQVASLRKRHLILGETVLTRGWAISVNNTNISMLPPLEKAVAAQPAIDAVYFISDFALRDDRSHDAEGGVRLRELIRSRRIRFYAATVNQPVPETYASLANESGGAVLTFDRRTLGR